jgi:hypothetical protein
MSAPDLKLALYQSEYSSKVISQSGFPTPALRFIYAARTVQQTYSSYNTTMISKAAEEQDGILFTVAGMIA